MGRVIDTDVWALAERTSSQLNLTRWAHCGGAYMSASTAERRAQHGAFVENLLASIPVLEFSMPVAQNHARMISVLSKSVAAGALDALIAATAVHHGFALLTRSAADFSLFAGLKVEAFSDAP